MSSDRRPIAPRQGSGSLVRVVPAGGMYRNAEYETSPVPRKRGRPKMTVNEEDGNTNNWKYAGDGRNFEDKPPRLQEGISPSKNRVHDSNVSGVSKAAGPSTSYAVTRTNEYSINDDDDDNYDVYDDLPERSIKREILSPHPHDRHVSQSMLNFGRKVAGIYKPFRSHEDIMQTVSHLCPQNFDIGDLVNRYNNSETKSEADGWSTSIALCTKMNLLSRNMATMEANMDRMMRMMQTVKRNGKYSRGTAEEGEGFAATATAALLKTLREKKAIGLPGPEFGTIPAAEGDFIVPPVYSDKEVDCRHLYKQLQRHGSRIKPGNPFLTQFIRFVLSEAVEAPHKYMLTVRSCKRGDGRLVNVDDSFVRPIEAFIFATCEGADVNIYTLAEAFKETLSRELRELRRTPRGTSSRYIENIGTSPNGDPNTVSIMRSMQRRQPVIRARNIVPSLLESKSRQAADPRTLNDVLLKSYEKEISNDMTSSQDAEQNEIEEEVEVEEEIIEEDEERSKHHDDDEEEEYQPTEISPNSSA